MSKFLLQKTHQANGLYPQIKHSMIYQTYDECIQNARAEALKDTNFFDAINGNLIAREVNEYHAGQPVIYIYDNVRDETFAWFITELSI